MTDLQNRRRLLGRKSGGRVNLWDWNKVPVAAPGFLGSSKVISADGSTISYTNNTGVESARITALNFAPSLLGLEGGKTYKIIITGDNLSTRSTRYSIIQFNNVAITKDFFGNLEYEWTQDADKVMNMILYETDYAIGSVLEVKIEIYEI